MVGGRLEAEPLQGRAKIGGGRDDVRGLQILALSDPHRGNLQFISQSHDQHLVHIRTGSGQILESSRILLLTLALFSETLPASNFISAGRRRRRL